MSTVAEITSLSDQAIAWVILLHSGKASAQDKADIQAWCQRTPEHAEAFAEAEQLWLEMGAALQPALMAGQQVVTGRKQYAYWATGAVAVMLLALLLNPLKHLSERWQSDYATLIGEQQQVTLRDGSRVFLNTDTALSVSMQANGRHIRLLHGQAQFSVAPDAQRPFEVSSDDASVQALGTVFEVSVEAQGTVVTVLEHAVGIKGATELTYDAHAAITEGQQVRYHREHGLGTIVAVDVKQHAAWQRGKLIVKDQTLAHVVAELNRYYPGKILLTNAQLATLRVTGVFPVHDPVAVLAMLEHTLPLKISRITPWLTLIHA